MYKDTKTKFKEVIKDSIHLELKPLGFKKKGNNFYRKMDGFGHLINVQKDRYNTTDEIKFRVNTGVFSDSYWRRNYNHKNQDTVPDFPREYECVLRLTMGELLGTDDLWYEISHNSSVSSLVKTIKKDFQTTVIPFYEKIKSEESLLTLLESKNLPEQWRDYDFEKLHYYLEFGFKEKAKACYQKIVKETDFKIARDNFIEEYKSYSFLQ